jgi:hypothetical protein
MQLLVNETLFDYRGYSGSAVTNERGEVIGVLVQQVLDRGRVARGDRRLAGNVLYAVSMDQAIRRFRLEAEHVAASERGTRSGLRLGAAPRGRQVEETRTWRRREPFFHPEGTIVNKIVFSPNGALLASAGTDDAVRIWSVTDDDEVAALDHDESIGPVVFSADGRRFATATAKTVRVRDTGAFGEPVWHYDALELLSGVALSPDGRLVATSGPEPHIFDISTGQSTRIADYLFGVTFSLDGRRLAGYGAQGLTHVWRIAELELRRPTRYRDGVAVQQVLFTPAGRWLVSVVDEGRPPQNPREGRPGAPPTRRGQPEGHRRRRGDRYSASSSQVSHATVTDRSDAWPRATTSGQV